MATKKNDTVFTNFVPASKALAPLAAAHTKAAKAESDALEALRKEVQKALVEANKIPADLGDRFRVSKRWGQYAWFVAAEKGAAQGKGEEL